MVWKMLRLNDNFISCNFNKPQFLAIKMGITYPFLIECSVNEVT